MESGSGEVSCSVLLLVVVIGFVPLEAPGSVPGSHKAATTFICPLYDLGYLCIFSYRAGCCQALERVMKWLCFEWLKIVRANAMPV
jgi:hypothetical protein